MILFGPDDDLNHLDTNDFRAQHITAILKLGKGDKFLSGWLNGPMGVSTITGINQTGLTLDHNWTIPAVQPAPLTLIIGLVRPPTAQRLLKDLTSSGVSALHFIVTRLTEKSYASSHLWVKNEYQKWLREGAQQTRTTRLPEVFFGETLKRALGRVQPMQKKYLLDPQGERFHFSDLPGEEETAVLLVGPERGLVDEEIAQCRESGFLLRSLSDRVLRTETACIGSTTLMLSGMKSD